MRLIDADALRKKAYHAYVYDELSCVVELSDIDDAPTVDSVKHGYWMLLPYGVRCSSCGEEYRIQSALPTLMPRKPWWNYCPNCGATMDLEVSE